VLETCHLVIDRPRNVDSIGLVYVAEAVGKTPQPPIATSPVFRPDIDPLSHRAALAQLESELRAAGWQREEGRGRKLIGVRFHRRTEQSHGS
jgi:hypothetical protein